MKLKNEKAQVVTINVLVNKQIYKEKMLPYDEITIPSHAHYRALLPFIRDFGLTIVHEEHDTGFSLPVLSGWSRQEESGESLTAFQSLRGDIDGPDALLHVLFDETTKTETSLQKGPLHTEEELQNKTKAQLRDLCVQYNLDVKGNKEEMIQRLSQRFAEDLL